MGPVFQILNAGYFWFKEHLQNLKCYVICWQMREIKVSILTFKGP